MKRLFRLIVCYCHAIANASTLQQPSTATLHFTIGARHKKPDTNATLAKEPKFTDAQLSFTSLG
jgi:hypothetical protein